MKPYIPPIITLKSIHFCEFIKHSLLHGYYCGLNHRTCPLHYRIGFCFHNFRFHISFSNL